jgi:hypothetical protein
MSHPSQTQTACSFIHRARPRSHALFRTHRHRFNKRTHAHTHTRTHAHTHTAPRCTCLPSRRISCVVRAEVQWVCLSDRLRAIKEDVFATPLSMPPRGRWGSWDLKRRYIDLLAKSEPYCTFVLIPAAAKRHSTCDTPIIAHIYLYYLVNHVLIIISLLRSLRAWLHLDRSRVGVCIQANSSFGPLSDKDARSWCGFSTSLAVNWHAVVCIKLGRSCVRSIAASPRVPQPRVIAAHEEKRSKILAKHATKKRTQ